MTAIFDIETNNLYYEATELHCISIKVDEDPTKVYTSKPLGHSNGTLKEGLDILAEANLLVGHNIINFDLPMLQKLYPDWTYKGELLDTLLVSKLMFPDMLVRDARRKSLPSKLKGRHSLESWGYRLRMLKGDFGKQEEAWDKLTPDMIEYCRQDSDVTFKLYNHLQTHKLYPPSEAIWLEQEFAKIISRQEKYGCYFDQKKAEALHRELLIEADKAEEELMKTFTPLKDFVSVNKQPQYTKSGRENKNYLAQVAKGCKDYPGLGWGYYKEVVFNPGSRQHIARWLQEVYDWKPKEHTEKGSIVINESVLNELEFTEGKILAHYFNVKKLLGQLALGPSAWLKQVKSDGRIHGSVDTLGAVSRRCTHNKPNMAQVPSSRAYKGHEARELFCVPKGKKLVGCDADGLELRTLSHYMARFDGGNYAKAVDEGKKENGTDIHTLNQKGAGLPTRDDAKTFIYAFLYGAGDGKIGEIVGGTSDDGARLKAKFFRQIPAIKKLVDQVAKVYKNTKTLKALDGNPYFIRSNHSALNTLLQGAGALVMKYYNVFADRNFQKKGWIPGVNYEQILSVHDECQWEVDEDIAEEFAKEAERSFNDVTEYLNFRIPIRGTTDIGDNWSQTH
jgi:DNA polymerase-1